MPCPPSEDGWAGIGRRRRPSSQAKQGCRVTLGGHPRDVGKAVFGRIGIACNKFSIMKTWKHPECLVIETGQGDNDTPTQ